MNLLSRRTLFGFVSLAAFWPRRAKAATVFSQADAMADAARWSVRHNRPSWWAFLSRDERGELVSNQWGCLIYIPPGHDAEAYLTKRLDKLKARREAKLETMNGWLG